MRISTSKLMWIYENCIIDEKFLGVLIINNGNEFGAMVVQKGNNYTENLKSESLTVPRGL